MIKRGGKNSRVDLNWVFTNLFECLILKALSMKTMPHGLVNVFWRRNSIFMNSELLEKRPLKP
jgi:hypothetical protein